MLMIKYLSSSLYPFPPLFVSSSSLPVVLSFMQHGDVCSPDMETSPTAEPIQPESIWHSHTICHTRLQHWALGGRKVPLHVGGSPAWHTLQGQSCGDYISQTPWCDFEAETQHRHGNRCNLKTTILTINLKTHLQDVWTLWSNLFLFPAQCPPGWLASGRSCYSVRRRALTWREAQRSCKRLAAGSHLADLKTPDDLLFVSSHLLSHNSLLLLWTGLSDQQV